MRGGEASSEFLISSFFFLFVCLFLVLLTSFS